MITIQQAAEIAFEAAADAALWGSIVINKRKPHTYRSFIQQGDSRICFHRFEPCEPEDSFAHPHPWPSSMLILDGEYEMAVGHTPDLRSGEPSPVINVKLSAGSIYEMNDRHTWHQVIPRTRCYSLMVNGARWEDAHLRAPSTGGKGLDSMSGEELATHLAKCRELIGEFLESK
jgi:hypothetical protein